MVLSGQQVQAQVQGRCVGELQGQWVTESLRHTAEGAVGSWEWQAPDPPPCARGGTRASLQGSRTV